MIKAILIFALLAVGGFFVLLFIGDSWQIDNPWYRSNPRMYVQPRIRPFQLAMPGPAAGSVPRSNAIRPLPTSRQAQNLTTMPATRADLARGNVYYQYYCISCHGVKGDGHGSVGESYVPKPADLSSPKIRGYSDGQLLRAMILGEGHEPVLEYTVLTEHRWPLVHYVRELGSGGSAK